MLSFFTYKKQGPNHVPSPPINIINTSTCIHPSLFFNMPANLENSAVATGLEKVSSFQSQRKAMPKNAQTTTQLHSSHTLVK